MEYSSGYITHKRIIKKFKETEIIVAIFSNYNEMQLSLTEGKLENSQIVEMKRHAPVQAMKSKKKSQRK